MTMTKEEAIEKIAQAFYLTEVPVRDAALQLGMLPDQLRIRIAEVAYDALYSTKTKEDFCSERIP